MRLEGNSNSFEHRSEIKRKKTVFQRSLWSGLRVSAGKTTECCFYKRCETKQGVSQAADLRRRSLTTMRLEWISNSFEPRAKIKNNLGEPRLSVWSGLRGSNPPPPPWQGGALPNELNPQNGASGRNRTNDTRIFSPLLYQLSYRGISGWRLGWGSNPRPLA